VKLLKLKNGFKIQPEYDDCREAAIKHKVPLRDILSMVRRQAEAAEGKEEGKIDEH
jgi:uncharacterized protein (DUF111 family)